MVIAGAGAPAAQRQEVNLLALRLAGTPCKQLKEEHCEVAIVGGGIGGMALAL
jgi:NADPH-dependent 2,4-dienoyl-CoA reductase/sulfur reductase-like enzyme